MKALHSLRKILSIEDDPDIQLVTRLALETVGGFEVCMCSSGREALGIVVGFKPDLILLDVMMPVMDGPATLRELRRLPSQAATPVVFVTAKVQPHEIEQLRALNVLDVIAKPFDPMALPERLKSVWSANRGG